MVSAKPIQFTRVSEVPLSASGAFLAINEENKGESAVPDNPQINKKINRAYTECEKRKIGESKQHKPDVARAIMAMRLAPNFWDNTPPTIQDKPPEPITKNENKGMFNCAAGCVLL